MVADQGSQRNLIVVVEVDGFGDPQRTVPDRRAVRAALYEVMAAAFTAAGTAWEDCYHEDRGDSVLAVVPAAAGTAAFVEAVLPMLVTRLRIHNDTHPVAQRFRARVVLHSGEVDYDEHGVTSASLMLAFRLCDAPPLKIALAASPGLLVVLASERLFEDVIRHIPTVAPAAWRSVSVAVKETTMRGWITLPDQPYLLSNEDLVAAGAVAVRAGHPRTGTSAPVPRQLPVAPAMFVGRSEELAALTTALDRAGGGGVLTISSLSGMPGVGKTSLAVQWGNRNADRFPDGQLFVDLRGFGPTRGPLEPSVAVRGFLDALGVDPTSMPVDLAAQTALYRSLLAGKRMLIILDNAASTDQVIPLLPGAPGCVVVVTSRQRLAGLARQYGAGSVSLGVLAEAEGRHLLTTYLGEERVAAEPDAADELLECCGGMPLALKIIAGRAAASPYIPLSVLAAEVRDATSRLDSLDDGDPATSLPAVLSWSIRALTDQQRTVFELLGIAPVPDISLPAVANLINLPQTQARRVLHALEEASLVEQRTRGRYAMHDLVRLTAHDRAHADLPDAVRQAAVTRLVQFYLHTARNADRLLSQRKEDLELDPLGPGTIPLAVVDADEAREWFDGEYQCVLAVQGYTLVVGWGPAVLQFAEVMDTYQRRRGTLDDHLACWRAALEATRRLSAPGTEALARRMLGVACSRAGLHTEALDHLQGALDLAQHLDERDVAEHHRALATVWERLGDDRQALHHASEALRLARSSSDVLAQAGAQNAVSRHHIRLGNVDSGREHCEAALELYRYHPHRAGEADAWHNLGDLAHRVGDHTEALQCFQYALDLRRELDDAYEKANILLALGDIYTSVGRDFEAQQSWEQARDLFTRQGRVDAANEISQRLAGLRRSAPGDTSDGEEVTVYTSGDDGRPVRDAVVDVLEAAGYAITAQQSPERGSWFQRLLAKQKDPEASKRLATTVTAAVANHLTSDTVDTVVQARDISVEIHAPDSTREEGMANSIARLLEACRGHDEVIVYTRSIMLVKLGPRTVSWEPTEEDHRVIKANPQLLHSAQDLLAMHITLARQERDDECAS